jgi:hypothetical protein
MRIVRTEAGLSLYIAVGADKNKTSERLGHGAEFDGNRPAAMRADFFGLD